MTVVANLSGRMVLLREVRRAPQGQVFGIYCGVDRWERDRTRRHLGTIHRLTGARLTVEDRCDRDSDATGVP